MVGTLPILVRELVAVGGHGGGWASSTVEYCIVLYCTL